MKEFAYLCRAMGLQNLSDIHTHHIGHQGALLSLPPVLAMQGCTTPYSIQLHPWYLTESPNSTYEKEDIATFLEAIEHCQEDPNLMAIGECGLDNICGVPLDIQLQAFQIALKTAIERGLPVIIHCVGYWTEMMACVKEYYSLPMGKECGGAIIHGFRKGPQLAQQLLREGFSISLGEKFNPEVARLLPEERLYIETDESNTDICLIREKILSLRKSNNTEQ